MTMLYRTVQTPTIRSTSCIPPRRPIFLSGVHGKGMCGSSGGFELYRWGRGGGGAGLRRSGFTLYKVRVSGAGRGGGGKAVRPGFAV